MGIAKYSYQWNFFKQPSENLYYFLGFVAADGYVSNCDIEIGINQKDKYSMFINGNHPLTIVKSSIKNGKKLIVFKDSYAHNFIPFLAMNFEEIHLIDLRYFNMNPYEYIREHDFDRALFLYNLSTFGTDSTFVKLKAFK